MFPILLCSGPFGFAQDQSLPAKNNTLLHAGDLSINIEVANHHFDGLHVHDGFSNRTIDLPESFVLVLKDKSVACAKRPALSAQLAHAPWHRLRQQAKDLTTDPGNDFADEVHSYFGTGTQLQEMYITPSLLPATDWDTLAEAARWNRSNADTLKDVHWIGGDPDQLQIYGWAAWSPREGVITLRNPSNGPQEFTIDVAKVFELQPSDPGTYKVRSVWKYEKNGTRNSPRRCAEIRDSRFISPHSRSLLSRPYLPIRQTERRISLDTKATA